MSKKKKPVKKSIPKVKKSPPTKSKKKKVHQSKSGILNINVNLLVLIALIITTIAFLPSLQNEFVNWDDDVNLYENENTNGLTAQNIKNIFTSDVIGNYNPLPILSFAIEREFFRTESTGLSYQQFDFTFTLCHSRF